MPVSIKPMSQFRRLFPWTWAVTASRRARKVWTILFLVIVIGCAAINVRAWIFRWQARIFLNDVRSLEMGKTPSQVALNLARKYPDHDVRAQTEGPCGPE